MRHVAGQCSRLGVARRFERRGGDSHPRFMFSEDCRVGECDYCSGMVGHRPCECECHDPDFSDDEESFFDADELGLDPEDDDER